MGRRKERRPFTVANIRHIKLSKYAYDRAVKFAKKGERVTSNYAMGDNVYIFSNLPHGGCKLIKRHVHELCFSGIIDYTVCKVVDDWQSYTRDELNEKFAGTEWFSCEDFKPMNNDRETPLCDRKECTNSSTCNLSEHKDDDLFIDYDWPPIDQALFRLLQKNRQILENNKN